jgi:hypothetical protein
MEKVKKILKWWWNTEYYYSLLICGLVLYFLSDYNRQAEALLIAGIVFWLFSIVKRRKN